MAQGGSERHVQAVIPLVFLFSVRFLHSSSSVCVMGLVSDRIGALGWTLHAGCLSFPFECGLNVTRCP